MHISRSVRRLDYNIRKIIEEKTGYKTLQLSERDGFTIFTVENTKRIIVWVRSSPITRKALVLFNKIIANYEYDDIIVFRTNKKPDYMKTPKEYRIVYSVEELLKTIQDVI